MEAVWVSRKPPVTMDRPRRDIKKPSRFGNFIEVPSSTEEDVAKVEQLTPELYDPLAGMDEFVGEVPTTPVFGNLVTPPPFIPKDSPVSASSSIQTPTKASSSPSTPPIIAADINKTSSEITATPTRDGVIHFPQKLQVPAHPNAWHHYMMPSNMVSGNSDFAALAHMMLEMQKQMQQELQKEIRQNHKEVLQCLDKLEKRQESQEKRLAKLERFEGTGGSRPDFLPFSSVEDIEEFEHFPQEAIDEMIAYLLPIIRKSTGSSAAELLRQTLDESTDVRLKITISRVEKDKKAIDKTQFCDVLLEILKKLGRDFRTKDRAELLSVLSAGLKVLKVVKRRKLK